MHIGINARFLLNQNLEGIGVFTHQICKRLVSLMPNHAFYFYFDRKYDNKFIYANNVIPRIVYPSARHPILWEIWFDYTLPKQLKKDKIDLFISFDGYCSLNTDVPQIVCVHDIAFEHNKTWTPKLHYQYMHHYTPLFLEKADRIITVSEFSKQDIIRCFNVDENKIEVIYNASSIVEDSNVQSDRKIESPYFLFIGAVHPRKNVLNLIKAFELFKQKNKNDIKLAIVGRNAWLNQSLHHYIKESAIKDDIIWYEKIDEQTKIQLLQDAYCLTFLSHFEGFGIPLVEAMQYGLPIICSDNSALPEIAKDAAIYAPSNDVDAISKQMERIVADKILYNNLKSNATKRFADFNWDKSAMRFYNLIQNYI